TNGASISVTASAGDLSADSINAFINNRNGGSIGGGAELNFDIGGTLTTQGDANIGISSRNDGTGGGTIAGDATVNIQASSMSIGGFFTEILSTNAGGHIGVSTMLALTALGGFHSESVTFFDLAIPSYIR